MKDLTPERLRCDIGASCPSVHQLEDGRLLIVGKRAPIAVDLKNPPLWQCIEICASMGPDEAAIVISPDLLSDYVAALNGGQA